MNVTFHDRATLGIGAPNPAHLSLRTGYEARTGHLGLTWHHTGADGTLFRPNPLERLQGIWRYHVEQLSYGDIAYNGAFDADGNTYGLREHRYVGAHATSSGNLANRVTDGVVFLEDRRGVTPAAVEAWQWWADFYHYVMGHPAQHWAHEAWAHGRGGTPTACPGADVIALVHSKGGTT